MNLTQEAIKSLRDIIDCEMLEDCIIRKGREALEAYDQGVQCAICKEKYPAKECRKQTPPICFTCQKELNWGGM